MRAGLELAGRYRLEGPIGRGGMGEVWRGVDLRLRRPVAVKLLPLNGAADGAEVARFRREAEIAATVNHPGITTVFDIDEHTDGGLRLFFLVMELMHGRDLASVLAGHPGGLPVTQVTDWAVQILAALAAAHRQGVVHRDIKPANLFLTGDGQVKVCDFGISRLADATRITATGAAAGTPLYMAPEQIEGHQVDQRTDLYAFGCVLYHLLTGTTWLDTGSSVGAILHQHLNRTPPSPRSLRPDIDDHLSTLVLNLLAKHPEDRPEDASTVAERLRGPVSGPAPGDRPTVADRPRPAQHDSDTRRLRAQVRTSPRGAAERSTPTTSQDGRTATAAMVLALLCIPGFALILVTFTLLDFPPGLIPLLWVNIALPVLGAFSLGTGALQLYRRSPAGRWIIAITSGMATVWLVQSTMYYSHAGVFIYWHVTTVYPMTAVLAIAAVIMALLPATGRWCQQTKRA
ncbi:serine/threonine-protein kinase [Actinomadura geliboluensis]|uniref:non-specific serine/threonine protein kinase n=1 Tax=Actinomadura geliboluensis TaxID=882440 RepID=A0A5S4FQR8_9ACTN|nr:serine/threonine-protein kinase [Actinomadura geliboluensis]TMR22764.1 serine/threonine protein kinase [Actinomadura geliboluensis]